MSKSIKSKNVKKSVTIKVGDKEIKTTCKTFGNCVKNAAGESVGKCKNCEKKSNDVFAACNEKYALDHPVKKEKSGKTKMARPFDCAFDMWMIGYDRKKIIETMIEKGMKDVPAKRFVADIFSVGNAAIGKAKKKGGLIEKYLNWAIYGEGKEPKGCKVTLGFCKQYARVFKTATI